MCWYYHLLNFRHCVSDHDRLLIGGEDGLYVVELLKDGIISTFYRLSIELLLLLKMLNADFTTAQLSLFIESVRGVTLCRMMIVDHINIIRGDVLRMVVDLVDIFVILTVLLCRFKWNVCH